MIQIKKKKLGLTIEAIVVVVLCFLLLGTASAQECNDLGRPLRGLCKAYCEFLDCDDTGDSRLCGFILNRYQDNSGGQLPPCLMADRCNAQVCGEYTFDCNPNNPNCLCVEIAETGEGSCVQDATCDSLQQCSSSSQCPSGFICAVNTCCGGGVCMPDNECANSATLESPGWDGPTVSGW